MLKKIYYFGLGLASVLIEKFDDLAGAGEELLAKRKSKLEEVEVAVAIMVETESVTETGQPALEIAKGDDLTAINGIGPTFANRLNEAGITTYGELAALTAEQLKEITHAADWQANPDDWVLQAKALV